MSVASEKAERLLSEALVVLRDDLFSLVDGAAVFGGGQPRAGSIPALDRTAIAELAGLVRRIEAEVGRPSDGQPGWLDAVLDGELAL